MDISRFTTILAFLWLFPGSCWAENSSKSACAIPRPSFAVPGDATVLGLFERHTGLNCSVSVTRGLHQMLSAVWIIQELNKQNFIPGVALGLWLYDFCSVSLPAQRTLVKTLTERECHKTYFSGMVTTPNIAAHLQEQTTAPVVAQSEHRHPSVVANLTATLLATLNWTIVSVVLAPSSQILSIFGKAAAQKNICIRQQISYSHSENRSWTSLFETSELLEAGHITVVFGTTDQIKHIVQSAHHDNINSTFQWLLVPLDMPQDFISFGSLPTDSLVVTPRKDVLKEIEENKKNLIDRSRSNNATKHMLRPAITSSPIFLEVALPIITFFQRLKDALPRYCNTKSKSNNSALCQDFPPFSEIPPSNIYNFKIAHEVLEAANIWKNISFYSVQRVRITPKYLVEEIGMFTMFDNDTSTFNFLDHINKSKLNLEESAESHHCKSDDMNSSCKDVCINMAKDEVKEDRDNPQHKTGLSKIEHMFLSPLSLRQELWVAAVASISAVGVLCSLAVSVFILVRVCKGDVLEGNPSFSFLLLIAINCTYFSILPFTLSADDAYHRGLICGLRIFGTSVSYALLFSIMLSRSFMLASCDQDGGFMSHVNGYLQTVLCFFIAGVQLALSVQFWAINSTLLGSQQCSSIYEGHLFLFLLSYDMFLLLLLVCTSPFIARSKRNYREGMFFTVASILCLLITIGWSAAYLLAPSKWQDAAITGGLTATATAILVSIFIPRTYLMMTAIVRDHLASALPSLAYTSTTSVQDINYRSTQVLYDTVAPQPPIHPPDSTGQVNPNFYSDQPQSPVDSGPETSAAKPRGFGERRNISPENTYERYDTPPSPHKVTRF
ncbi:protein bride of sevenless [Periplaneta americana]|uniref:protein bride of sevenless n=1 Tax=Periplaneta americana TaxID=6978 RepID=UPI0037E97167